MGFITTGFPSYSRKRRCIKYNHRFHSSVYEASPIVDNTDTLLFSGNATKIGQRYTWQKVEFENLPVEVIQRIFIYSDGYSRMCCLNKSFNKILASQRSLVFDSIRYNHLYFSTDHKLCIDRKVFERYIYFSALMSHDGINWLKDLKIDIESEETTNEDNDNKVTKYYDYPKHFYNNINIFWEYSDDPEIFDLLEKVFNIQDPDLFGIRMIDYYFDDKIPDYNNLLKLFKYLSLHLLRNKVDPNIVVQQENQYTLSSAFLTHLIDRFKIQRSDGNFDDRCATDIIPLFIREFYKDSINEKWIWKLILSFENIALFEKLQGLSSKKFNHFDLI